jgi:hypothetical protein
MPACSYCGNISHNIRNCDNPFITVYYVNIKFQYLDCINLNPINPQLIFTTTVSRIYNLSIIKAVSVKFTNSPAYLNKTAHLIKLFEHFSHIGSNTVFRTPDPIPSYAQDLNADYEAPEEIHWYIDRMPSPTARIYTRRYLMQDLIEVVDELIPFHHDGLYDDSSLKKYCIKPILKADDTNNNINKTLEDCPICYEHMDKIDSVTLNCNHKFCGTCIQSVLKTQRFKDCTPSCALCRESINTIIVENEENYKNISEFCIL